MKETRGSAEYREGCGRRNRTKMIKKKMKRKRRRRIRRRHKKKKQYK